MVELRTTYMGLSLAHPVVASASPLSKDTDGVKRLEDAGAAAVVMFSLFEEQLAHEQAALEHLSQHGAESFAESLSYFPALDSYRVGPDRYLELIRRARESVQVPIIASLNGVTNQGWIQYAKQMHQAGASAIELNVYFIPSDLELTGRQVEERYLDVLRAVKAAVPVPVSVKLSPFFSAVGNMALQLERAGADALVLFNRFYQPDLDLEKFEVISNLELSTASEMRLPMLWIAILRGRVRASLAASTGVQSFIDVVKYLLAGADVVMTTSALLKHGPSHLRSLVHGLAEWMERHKYDSVQRMRGAMSKDKVGNGAAYERANYIKILESYKNPFMT